MIRYSSTNAATQRVQAPVPEASRGAIELAGIRLDPLSGEVFRNGKRAMLTRREMIALKALLEAYPNPVPGTEVIEILSSVMAVTNSDVLDMLFYRLRPKLVPIRATVQCAYGKGYKLTFL